MFLLDGGLNCRPKHECCNLLQKHGTAIVPVTAVDATGAGDCFDGAFLTRLSKGDTPEAACHYAVAASALSVQGYGAVAPLPTVADMAAG